MPRHVLFSSLLLLLFTGIQCSTTKVFRVAPTESFYHGTNSVFGYYVCRGIDLNAGREALDFNAEHAKAFYVTKDRALAEKWAANKAKMFGGSPVVIRYSVSSNFRNDFGGKILDDRDEWAEFVKLSRANANKHKYKFVEGMVLKNPGDEAKKAEGFGHQLAITNQGLANFFSQHETAGCEHVGAPPKESIFDESGKTYKKIPHSQRHEHTGDSTRSLIYRVPDLQVYLLEKPAQRRHSKDIGHERLTDISIIKQLGLLPATYTAQWDSKHQYLITPYIPGQTLEEIFNDETFWEPQSKRRAKLIRLIHNLIDQGIFVRGMSPRNLVYSSGQWFLISSQELSAGLSLILARGLFARDRRDSLAKLWLNSAGIKRKKETKRLIDDALCHFENNTEKCLTFVSSSPLQSKLPSVTIVVATYGKRHGYHKHLYENFKQQDYKGPLTLLIYDNAGTASPFFDTLNDSKVTYMHTTKTLKELSLGAKRNWLGDNAPGEIIVVFDDDDFYGSNYVSFMISEMMRTNASLMRAKTWLMSHFNAPGAGLAYNMVTPKGAPTGWGFAFVFKKSIMATCRYADKNRIEEDPLARCVATNPDMKMVSVVFDTPNKNPLMLKFESHTPRNIQPKTWTGPTGIYEFLYSSTGRRAPGAEYTKGQVLNIFSNQKKLIEKYINFYYSTGKI